MVDTLGLGTNATNVVTIRPTDSRVLSTTDTWLKDCSSPSAQDGTVVPASWLNSMLANLRQAIRGSGLVTEDNSDYMLWNAINRYVPKAPMTTFYVATTGNDSNPGTSGAPFATPAGAVAYASQFQANSVTINIAAGTYTIGSNGTAASIPKCLIANWNFVGAGAGSTIINATTGTGYGFVTSGPTVTVHDLTVNATANAFLSQNGGTMTVYNIAGALQTGQNYFGCGNGAQLAVYGSVALSGSGASVFNAQGQITLGTNGGTALSLTASSLTVSAAFVVATNLGYVYAWNGYVSFSGTVTGSRYSSTWGALVQTNTGNVNFFPGSTAGATSNGGLYN